jgi:hypothetical protein
MALLLSFGAWSYSPFFAQDSAVFALTHAKTLSISAANVELTRAHANPSVFDAEQQIKLGY